jgi:hypothetical protein
MAVVVATGYIAWLGATEPGSFHDKTICLGLSFQKDTVLLCDLAYLGYKAENAKVVVPHKKPKGGTLTDEQKQQNREHSRQRIAVEHAFAKLKSFKILSRRLMGRMSKDADLFIRIVASIYNFKLDFSK